MKQVLPYLLFFFFCSSVKATTYTVVNANASGAGSLLEAIDNANLNLGADNIEFNITGMAPHTIPLAITSVINISDPLIIDGTTQPANGYTGACPKVVLDASAVDTGIGSLIAIYATDVSIYGLWFKNFTNPSSTVLIVAERNVKIGGPGKRNLFTNNVYSINIAASDAEVSSNYFGCDCDGALAESNSGIGIWANGPVENITISDNLIASNSDGIVVGNVGSPSINIIIKSNKIGTDVSGTSAIGNTFYGMDLRNVVDLQLGGSGSGEGNLVSGNGRSGCRLISCSGIVYGNKVGTDITGNDSLPNDPLNLQYSTAFNCNGDPGLSGSLVVGGMGAGEQNVFFGNNIAFNIADYSGNYSIVNNLIGQTYSGLVSPLQSIGFQLYYDTGTVELRSNYLAGDIACFATECKNFTAEENIIGTDFNNIPLSLFQGFYVLTADSFSLSNNIIRNCQEGVSFSDCNDSYLGGNSIENCNTAISMFINTTSCRRNKMDRNSLSFNLNAVELNNGTASAANDDILPPVIVGSNADSTWGTAVPFALVDLSRDTTLSGSPQGYDYSIPQINADAGGHWVYIGHLQNPNDYTAQQTDPTNNSSGFSERLTLNVNELDKKAIRVYPVPVKNILMVENLSGDNFQEWNIYNVLGELVLGEVEEHESVQKIKVGQLHSGFYFIKINTPSGILTAKFLKQ